MAEGWRKFEKRQAVRAIDVARAAGVSQSAVSRAFRDGSVAPHRRAEILTIAKSLGYRPDAMARSIITRRSGIVGILINADANLQSPDALTALCRAIVTQKMRAMVFVVETAAEIDEAVEQLLAYRVDGVIALTDIAVEHARSLSQLGSILVFYNRDMNGAAANWVGCDNTYDGETLARHILGRGATTLWILEGPRTSSLATQRLDGIVRGLKSSPEEVTVESHIGDFSFESGFQAVARLLEARKVEPDAIVAVNSMMAIGAVEGLRAVGYAGYRKVLIAGFDGLAAASWPRSQIIVMEQPHEQLAAAAVTMIVAHLHGDLDLVERKTFRSILAILSQDQSCRVVQGSWLLA